MTVQYEMQHITRRWRFVCDCGHVGLWQETKWFAIQDAATHQRGDALRRAQA